MTTPRGPFTRSGIRRSGDDYQDLCALEIFVEMLEHQARYKWVKVEADDAGALDDILALREDGSLVARQVKFSGHPDEDSDPWTWDKFLAEPMRSGNKTPSLLFKWFSAWQLLKTQEAKVDVSLESNRRGAQELVDTIDPNGFISVDKIPPPIWSTILGQLGEEDDVISFLSDFRFRLDRPGLNEIEDGLLRRFFEIGGTQEGWFSLKDRLRLWVRERYQPPPDGAIDVAAVRSAASWHSLTSLPEDLRIPDDYILPSQSFHDSFYESVLHSNQSCKVLTAPPALGKSTYLSYLVRQLRESDVPVVRHHYFLSLDDRTPGRYDHLRIAESLMSELEALYPDALSEIGPRNPNPEDLSEWLDAAGGYYSSRGQALVVVIDGLDHVWRERVSRDELDRLFEYLLPAPKGVIIVVGTQAVDDEQLPTLLLRECPKEKWTQLEPLDLDAVAAWLETHGHEIGLPSDSHDRQMDLDDLASAFFKKTEGHPLHLQFALASLLELGQGVNRYTVEELPGTPGKNIMEYYADLWRRLPESGREVLHLLASTNFAWPTSGFAEALDPQGNDLASRQSAYRQVRHLLATTPIGLQAFHGSLLIFVRSQESHPAYAHSMKAKAREWLATSAPLYWQWAFSWILDAEDGQAATLIDGPSREWVIESLLHGYPREQVSEILGRSAWAALENGQLGRFVEVALLRDYLEWDEYPPLLRIQLHLGHDVRLGDVTLSKLATAAITEIVSLAHHEYLQGNLAAVKECFDALNRRRPRGGRPDEQIEWARSLMSVGALLPNLALARITEFIGQFRSSEGNVEIVDSFASRMRSEADLSRLRELLTASDLNVDEQISVRQHAIMLAFESDLEIGLPELLIWDDPFSSIYRCLKLNDYQSGPSTSYPQFSLLKPSDDYSSLNRAITWFFKLSFYALFTSHLRNETATIDQWLAQSPTPYVSDLLARLNHLAETVAASAASKDEIPFSEPYRYFEDSMLPNRWRDNETFRIGRGMQIALSEISFDLAYVQRQWVAPGEVSIDQLREIFLSPLVNPWDWIVSYIGYAKPFLSEPAVAWMIDDLEKNWIRISSRFPVKQKDWRTYQRLRWSMAVKKRRLNAF